MKPKKIAILGIDTLEGETFKNFLADHPFSGIEFFYFQEKETAFKKSPDGVSLILEESKENLIDFPLVISFKKEKKINFEIDGSIIYLEPFEEGKLIYYGINHKGLLNENILRIPHPLSCLMLRIFENFKENPPQNVFCSSILSTSEEGKEGQDELYNQTIALLNFSSFKNKIYKTQIAFNISIFPDLSFCKRIENEVNFFFENLFPIQMQFGRSGTFFGSFSFLNIVFSSNEKKESYKNWLSKKEDFIFSSKNEGVVEAVQAGKVFVNIKDSSQENTLNFMIFADQLYSGMSYNLHNLIEEYFKARNMLK